MENIEENKNDEPNVTKNKFLKVIKLILFVLVSIILTVLTCIFVILIILLGATKNIKRLDDEGYLYSLDYVGNNELSLLRLPVNILTRGGCSAFISINEKGEVITGRNYDLPHKDKNNKITGLNVVFKLDKKGKYKSINIADAAWIAYMGAPYYNGALDNRKVSKLFLAFLPYLVMDALNEKGLHVSMLALDTKKNETPTHQKEKGKKNAVISEMLRYIIDYCADVDEAIEKSKNYNLVNKFGYDTHLFLTDSTGKSAVLEWRHDKLNVTYIDACTNFYVSSDDAEDCYMNGQLKEKFVMPKEKKGNISMDMVMDMEDLILLLLSWINI